MATSNELNTFNVKRGWDDYKRIQLRKR